MQVFQQYVTKISVITVTYNSAETLEDTLKSVKSQNFNDVEHIIMDGGSSDETLKILDSYKDCLAVVVSEPDDGIYDAFNKALTRVSGDIVAILNSDDVFYDDKVLALVGETFNKTGCDIVYGDSVMVRQDDLYSIVRFWKSSKFILGSFKDGWHPPHPSFFVRKSVYDSFGNFDTSIPVAADFELMLRFLEINKVKAEYIPRVLTRMRVGGHSQNIKNIISGAKSIKKAFHKYKIKINTARYFLIRYASKLEELFRARLIFGRKI